MPSFAFRIAGIEPKHDLAWLAAGEAVHRQFWQQVVKLVCEVKDAELAAGLDRFGKPLAPIAPSTRKKGRWRSHTGMGSADAPPLDPAYRLSRTRSLFAGRAKADHAEFFWRRDEVTGLPWGKVLGWHRAGVNKPGRPTLPVRDVIGLSLASLAKVKARADQWWAHFKAGKAAEEKAKTFVLAPPFAPPKPAPVAAKGPTINLAHATLGINADLIKQAAAAGTLSAPKKLGELPTKPKPAPKPAPAPAPKLAPPPPPKPPIAPPKPAPAPTPPKPKPTPAAPKPPPPVQVIPPPKPKGEPIPPKPAPPPKPIVPKMAAPPKPVVPKMAAPKPAPPPKAKPKPAPPAPPPKPVVKAPEPPKPAPPPPAAPKPAGWQPRKQSEFQAFGAGKEMEAFGKESFGAWADSLTQPDKNAIKLYAADNYKWMNAILRGADPATVNLPHGLSEQGAKDYIARTIAPLARGVVDRDVVAYRGVKSLDAMGIDPAKLAQGQELTVSGFLSTTLKRDKANDFAVGNVGPEPSTSTRAILQVNTPKGSTGAYLNAAELSGYADERELLMPPDVKLRFVRNGGIHKDVWGNETPILVFERVK